MWMHEEEQSETVVRRQESGSEERRTTWWRRRKERVMRGDGEREIPEGEAKGGIERGIIMEVWN